MCRNTGVSYKEQIHVKLLHFVVVSDVNNAVMTTPAANNGHDDVTGLECCDIMNMP